MLTVFNNGVGYPLVYDDYYIRELASGLNEIIFSVSVRDEMYRYITEEAVLRDRDEQTYLIKQIDAGEERAKVVAQIDLDDWKASMLLNYSNNSKTVAATITEVAPQGWAINDQSMKAIRRTIPQSNDNKEYNVTPLAVVMECCEVYSVRVRFDNKNKIIYIIDPNLYANVGAYATRDLNLKMLNYKGKSDNFVTRLYAVGADGLTFASINDGKPYVENYIYSSKVISAYWEDNRYTDAQSLLDDATERLAEMAKPSRSYDCEVLDLAKTNPEIYNFENFALFNVITLIDDVKRERMEYQIVERWDYPYYPAKNKIVLSSVTPKLQNVVTMISNAINNPTSVFSQKLVSSILSTTALITGNKGGFIVLRDSDNDGKPDELLVMDTESIETATQVWRWNKSGLGYSNTGYNGTYILGMNMLGQINASMITVGALDADIITAGILHDFNDTNYWNLETGEFRLSAGVTVGGKTVAEIASEEATEGLSTWITNTYNVDMQSIQTQIDGKIETYYQAADPSSSWTTSEIKAKHVGDLWYKTTDDTTWYYDYSNNTYSWKQQNVPTAVFDEIDGKAQIFTTQPVPPYSVGDLWCEGASGDILTCTTAKGSGQSYSASDWTKLNKYTDNSDLTSFINTTYATDKEAMIGLIDSKAETWYQSTDPAIAWTTTELKDAHVGDLWYNTTNDTTWYYQKSGSTYSWQQQNIPQAVFDEIDGKAQIFITQPVPPYNVGDLWCEGASGDILSCVTAKTAGQSFSVDDWAKRNKYTDNSALTTFINTTYVGDKQILEAQIDKKAETWYQNTDPALDWTTADEKAEHVGDLWYNTTNGTTWYYDFSNNTYSWKQQNVPQAVFDEIDGKARIFITQPVPPYDVGDLWCKGTSGGIYNCVTAKASGQSYSADDWEIKNNYIDSAEVTSQINAYDTTLNQSAVFNKLTNNGTAQGIFLQNGNLYINGAYIQANTISANALTVQAKNDLQPLHNYAPYDIFSNVSRWEINAKAVSIGQMSIDGTIRPVLILDGTDIQSYTASYQTQIKTSIIGNPQIKVSFKYYIDVHGTKTVTSQQFYYLWYRDTDNNNTYREFSMGTISGEITGQVWNDETYTGIATGSSSREVSPIYAARFGFRFIPGCKVYIYDLEITGTNESYTEAKMEFTVDGLDSTVQKGSIISNINQSAEAVTINANKINLTGALSLQGDFHCYQGNNNANYAYLNDGQLSFFNNSNNVFTISSRGAYGDDAGIYFGEFAGTFATGRTRITGTEIRSTGVYIGDNGNERARNELLVQKPATFDDAAQFNDNVNFSSNVEFISNPTFDSGLTCNTDLVINGRLEVNNTSFISEIYGTTRFYGQVENENGGAVFVSDRRKKRNIKDLVIDKARSFIMGLKPVRYKFIEDMSKSDRYHHGFIAQDVREVMPEDWGLYCESKDHDFIGLRYDEFIADMVAVIQDQEKRIEALERRIHDLTVNKD